MEAVLPADAMRFADERTIEDYGVPSFTLMENAGRQAADRIDTTYGTSFTTVTILAGKGNNGGDGLVIARQLLQRGYGVRVVLIGEKANCSPDTTRNLELLEQLQTHSDHLMIESFQTLDQLAENPTPDLWVDALLGTGITNELRSPIREIVDWLNNRSEPVVAVDSPTGLHNDLGTVLGNAVRADMTITMGTRKTGQLMNDGPTHTGEIQTVEIGIPEFILEEAVRTHHGSYTLTDQDVQHWLPHRSRSAHKYSVGLVLALGGSTGLTGAPVMASMAAARSGAGAVVCGCPAPIQPTLEAKLTEVMTVGLPATEHGTLDERALDNGELQERLTKAGALLVGCGLGRHDGTSALVQSILMDTQVPGILDADGLNAISNRTDLLSEHADGRWVLTPHPGEFKRLVDDESVDLTDRIAVTRAYAQRWNVILLLKGMPGVVGCPDGRTFINTTGNPAVASAGTGDVLAGIIASLLAQGLSPDKAAAGGLHIAGAAADRYVREKAPRSLLAMDLVELLPDILFTRFS